MGFAALNPSYGRLRGGCSQFRTIPMLDDLLQRRPYNAASDFVDANVARGLGQKVAFIDTERTLTYGELQARTFQFAAALKTLGLRPEDRLLLLLPDTVDYPVAFWGDAPRRRRRHSAQHAARARHLRLHHGRQPGDHAGRSRAAGTQHPADPRPHPAPAHHRAGRRERRRRRGIPQPRGAPVRRPAGA